MVVVVVVAVVVVVVKDAPVIRSKGDGASNGRVAGSERLVVEETVEAASRKEIKNEKRALQCRSLACARGKQKQPNRNPTAAPLDIARRTLTTLPFNK